MIDRENLILVTRELKNKKLSRFEFQVVHSNYGTTLNTDQKWILNLIHNFLPKSCRELTKCFDFQGCFSNPSASDFFENNELKEELWNPVKKYPMQFVKILNSFFVKT